MSLSKYKVPSSIQLPKSSLTSSSHPKRQVFTFEIHYVWILFDFFYATIQGWAIVVLDLENFKNFPIGQFELILPPLSKALL